MSLLTKVIKDALDVIDKVTIEQLAEMRLYKSYENDNVGFSLVDYKPPFITDFWAVLTPFFKEAQEQKLGQDQIVPMMIEVFNQNPSLMQQVSTAKMKVLSEFVPDGKTDFMLTTICSTLYYAITHIELENELLNTTMEEEAALLETEEITIAALQREMDQADEIYMQNCFTKTCQVRIDNWSAEIMAEFDKYPNIYMSYICQQTNKFNPAWFYDEHKIQDLENNQLVPVQIKLAIKKAVAVSKAKDRLVDSVANPDVKARFAQFNQDINSMTPLLKINRDSVGLAFLKRIALIFSLGRAARFLERTNGGVFASEIGSLFSFFRPKLERNRLAAISASDVGLPVHSMA